jgi:lipoprotein NlpD
MNTTSALPFRPAIGGLFCLLCAAVVLGGCANRSHRAPVEERSSGVKPTASAAAAAGASASMTVGTNAVPSASPEAPASKPLPGAENAGKPGYYTVKPGDTLIRIGLENGQNWRDVARWSGLDNPNIIEVGQVLRVVPPSADAHGVVVRPVVPGSRVDGRPLDARASENRPAGAAVAVPGTSGSAAPSPNAAVPASAPGAAPVAAASPTASPATGATQVPRETEDEVNWAWPAAGAVVNAFDDNKSKGLAIAGKPGDPVTAAADGRVVYAGSGLRGYGNLVIVKHNATYLTAYAHNQALLVKEDQVVRRGQKIAEMGSTDAERVQLHFEIRRLGKPIDPARLLPAR